MKNGNISHSNLKAGNFAGLFADFTTSKNSAAALITAPELPATNLTNECYADMFTGCTNLTVAPKLPAKTLADGCYFDMFYGCTNLTSAPELPATNLAVDCYNSMFSGCTSLTSAPELPATTLAQSCYAHMFQECTSLTSAPELPATTVVDICYAYMFSGCTSLNYVNVGLTDWIGSVNTGTIPTDSWLWNVSPTGTFVCPEELDRTQRGHHYIPKGWYVNVKTS